MTEKDEVKPFHAKDVASGQEAADAVAAVLKHAHERDEAAKQKVGPKQQPKWLLPLGINLGIFAAYLLVFNPQWVVVNRIAPPPTEQQVSNRANAIFIYASKIEQYRNTNGRLPRDLAEAGVSASGLDYTVQGSNSYILYADVGGQPITYNSAVDDLATWGAANAGSLGARIGG